MYDAMSVNRTEGWTDMTKKKKGEQKQGTCVYCGTEGPITDEHVFPEVIFHELDDNMVIVPACDACLTGPPDLGPSRR